MGPGQNRPWISFCESGFSASLAEQCIYWSESFQCVSTYIYTLCISAKLPETSYNQFIIVYRRKISRVLPNDEVVRVLTAMLYTI